jgi:uncharacterized Tic20 family protein
MAAVGRSQRRNGPIAAANGRNAANWGLTYLLLTVPLVTLHFVFLFWFTRDRPSGEFFPIGIPLTVWIVLSVVFVVVCFVGVTRANKGLVFTAPAIRFFRT